MASELRLMLVFAHPDDETLGAGSTFARYAAEGVEVSLVTATRGERGWQGSPDENPGFEGLAAIRTEEMLNAGRVLGLKRVDFLDYIDGDLDQADPLCAIAKIVTHLRRVRPQVVVTFGPDGSYGHPDHIAISQFTTAACVRAADAQYADPDGLPAHQVAKLYYMVDTDASIAGYEAIIGDIAFPVDGVVRRAVGWEEWAVTTWVDGTAHWRTALQATLCHRSQLINFPDLSAIPDAQQEELWGMRSFYRAYSLVNGGRQTEHDLFEGLR